MTICKVAKICDNAWIVRQVVIVAKIHNVSAIIARGLDVLHQENNPIKKCVLANGQINRKTCFFFKDLSNK